MTNEEQKLINCALEWRRTEREMIADKANKEKLQAHIKSKLILRDAADVMIKRGQP
jgi:hypothetical protein